MLRTTVLAASAAGLVLGAAAHARAACTLGKAQVPVTLVGSQPSVEVKLDGQPARLEVDSGAFFSTLSAAAAKQLKLQTSPAPFNFRVRGVGGDAASVDVAKAKLEFGGSQATGMQFVVTPGLQGDFGIVGLLGRNILTHWDIEYDFARGQIDFVTPHGCGSTRLAYWSPATASMLPMASETNPVMRPATAWIKINGADIKALFDTGAGTSGLTREGARKAHLDVNSPDAKPAGYTHGIGRRMSRTWIVPVSQVTIGDEVIKNTKIRVSDYDLGGYDMLVGADFFLSHHVYIANSQEKIYFTYNGGPVFDLSVKPGAPPPPEPSVVAALQPAPPADGAAPPATSPAVAEEEPRDADGFSRRGQARVARRDYAGALADLSRAVELAPGDARYLRERAQLRLLTRQPFLAMTDLDAALKLTPDDAETLLVRARLRATGRDRAGELADLDAADRAAAPQADLRLGLGGAYSGLERYDLAIRQYDLWLAAHRGDSREPQALNGRAWARAVSNTDIDAGLRDADAALRLQPRTASFLDTRGLLRLRRGEWDRATGDYDAALALQPKLAWALYGRGVARTRRGDAAGGAADVAAATALNANAVALARRSGVAP